MALWATRGLVATRWVGLFGASSAKSQWRCVRTRFANPHFNITPPGPRTTYHGAHLAASGQFRHDAQLHYSSQPGSYKQPVHTLSYSAVRNPVALQIAPNSFPVRTQFAHPATLHPPVTSLRHCFVMAALAELSSMPCSTTPPSSFRLVPSWCWVN